MIRASTGSPDLDCARQYAAACRMVAKCPLRCTAMTASNSSSLVLANIRSRTMPALFTSTSSPPKVSTAVWIEALPPASQSATLDPLATASPPAAAISSTTPWAALPPPAGDPSRPTPMSLTTTRAPSPAKASACARPIPPPAPVTMTTRPSSNPISLLHHLLALEASRYGGGSPPPCTSRVAPLMYDAWSEARKAAAQPMSAGLASRPSGTVAPTAATDAASP